MLCFLLTFFTPISSNSLLAQEIFLETNSPVATDELPSALAEDDSFEDLPFEQLRQALREEVEQDSNAKNRSRYLKKKYNLFIR